MTKIKNTKKGMAKKTLSMSLVVAMLATSNVPVWAAEFSDGPDIPVTSEVPVADTISDFSDDATETPVVTDNTVEDAAASAAQVADGYKLTSNVELKTTTGDWSGALTLAAKDGVKKGEESFVITDKDGIEVSPSKIEVYYNNDIQDTGKAATSLTEINSTLNNYTPGLSTYKNGKAVSVKVYVANVNDAVATLDYTLSAVDISGKDVAYASGAANTDKEADYDGSAHYPKNVEVKGMGGSKAPVTGTDVTIRYEKSTDGIDAGAYTFYAEGIPDAGYTGRTKVSTDKFTVNKADVTATGAEKKINVTVSGDVAYSGNAVKPSSIVVTDKTTGKVISSDLYTVTTNNTSVGTYDSTVKTAENGKNPLGITIAMKDDNSATEDDPAKIITNNFKGTVNAAAVTGSYKITALDLNTLPNKYDITAPVKTVAPNNVYTISWSDLTFVDKSTGKTVAASNIIANDNNLTVVATAEKGATSGTVTVSASAAAAGKVTNSFKVNFRIADAAKTAADVRIPAGTKIGAYTVKDNDTLETLKSEINTELAKTVYTGEALEPLKDALTHLVWKDKGPDKKDMALVYGTDYTVTYANNVESDVVKKAEKKDAGTVTIKFIGKYSGEIKFNLPIKQADVTVDGEKLTYEAGKTSYDAKVKVVTKDANGKDVAVPESNYTVEYLTKATSVKSGENKATAKVTFTNKNYKVVNADTNSKDLVKTVTSTLEGKKLSDDSITAQVTGSYTYTGKTIIPTLEVKDGNVTLVEGKDYKVTNKSGVEAGEATVAIEAIADGNYTGTRTVKYTIAKADLKDAKVVSAKTAADKVANYDQVYTGQVQGPDIKEITIGGAKLEKYDATTKKGDYTITYDESAKEVGTYNYTITAVASSTKIQGTITGTYKITAAELKAHFALKSSTSAKATNLTPNEAYYINYTGKEITLNDLKQRYVVVDEKNNVLTEGKDYRLEYENNVDAGEATVYVYGLGNYAYTEDGKEISIASANYIIKGTAIINDTDIKSVSDVEYAGGLYVEPKVVVKVNGKTLVQGTDYTVETGVNEVGEYHYWDIKVEGKGAYVAGDEHNSGIGIASSKTWKVTKKDLANTTVSVDKNNNVTVVNGTVIVPSSEYDVKFSEDGKKVTVTAKVNSKNYTGSKELDVNVAKVGAPMIDRINVSGNNATVILSDEAEGASGYDYVISTSNDPTDKEARIDVVKNQVQTLANFKYVPQGMYYAYCHAWTRDENGKKVFGEWSNVKSFTVTATTPKAPEILSVKRSGSTITVTYKESAYSEGYDVVLGNGSKKEHGETRPYQYGKYKKLNVKPGVCKAVFKNIPAGTYYVGVHSWNRSAEENNNKVFSKWSDLEKVTVK